MRDPRVGDLRDSIHRDGNRVVDILQRRKLRSRMVVHIGEMMLPRRSNQFSEKSRRTTFAFRAIISDTFPIYLMRSVLTVHAINISIQYQFHFPALYSENFCICKENGN